MFVSGPKQTKTRISLLPWLQFLKYIQNVRSAVVHLLQKLGAFPGITPKKVALSSYESLSFRQTLSSENKYGLKWCSLLDTEK